MFARPSALTFFLFFLLLPFLRPSVCFNGSLGRSSDFTAQELIQFILQPVNLLFEVGCVLGSCSGVRFVMFIRPSGDLVPRMASFAALATRNFTTRLAGILMASPVAGFRPIRALRFTNTSLPNPGMVNLFFAFL